MSGLLRFPDGFTWGAATSAFQIEGAAASRARSIWDTFCERPGAVADGSSGVSACDHVHRWREDVAMMADLGLQAYRFSLSWPRIQPAGAGRPDQRGLDFYRSLLEELQRRAIEPVVTLYHWDLPQPLEDRGGWRLRETAERFADFAELVGREFGAGLGRVVTVNEPWCAAFLGYGSGLHAPGVQDPPGAVRAAHHLLLGHGLAVRRLREVLPDVPLGIALNLYPVHPRTDSPADRDAAHRIDLLMNRLFLEPVTTARYETDVLHHIGRTAGLDHLREGDEAVIGAPLDFLGVNYYSSHTVGEGTAQDAPSPWVGAEDVVFHPRGARTTAMGWDVDPDGLREVLLRLRDQCPDLPLWITETGAAYEDRPDADGRVDDRGRIAFLRDHLTALHAALAEGADVRGCLVWSLMDNFEWSEGFTRRFGLVHVDHSTQRRTPKASAAWYAGVIGRNGVLSPGR